ncbi:MAG: MBL fold metallo-hydrolase [Halanaerobiales bacterium]|nr:MBL fold metallo-hydrolase [Halanaerobiales bacterium]
MEITFLGTGTSHGVPIVGCKCKTCLSDDPKNNRLRSSIYIKSEQKNILIDTTPELRLQLLRNDITDINLVLFTHSHADHIMGFDDLRAINRINKKDIPCYGNKDTLDDIKKKFEYIFKDHKHKFAIPGVNLKEIENKINFDDLEIIPIPIKHNNDSILGYRINDAAYLTDCSFIPESSYKLLEGIEVLIIDALRYKKHPKHFNIEQAINAARNIGVKQAYLTHISHEIEHNEADQKLPEGINLAYDGLKIKL